MIYWPGTNIPKSKNNAFDWKKDKSIIVDKAFLQQQAVVLSNNTTEFKKAANFKINYNKTRK